MIKLTIELATDAAEADRKALSHGIIAFNRTVVPDLERIDEAVDFHIFARDERGGVRGGLRASCYWNTLHIELLWLDDAFRGSGFGTALMQLAEDHARASGCALAHVETTSWQALSFYEKLGYTLMGTLEGRPIGHSSHYLTKRLNPENS